MLSAIVAITLLASIFGLLLGYAAIRFRVEHNPIVERIDALLPQTQCGQCSYPGCRPYAEAIANGEADINHCPPGGMSTVNALADLLGMDPKPLDSEEEEEPPGRKVVIINEQQCIGCTLCIQACPVDAIIGAAKQMHVILTKECTGCELCLPPCPVDCINIIYEELPPSQWQWPYPVASLPLDPVTPTVKKQ